MVQLSLRVSDAVAERVRGAALHAGLSVNQYVVDVLDAATDPDLEDDDVVRVRERLARAGLLQAPVVDRSSRRPEPDAVAAARRRAGSGTSLAELVSEQRR